MLMKDKQMLFLSDVQVALATSGSTSVTLERPLYISLCSYYLLLELEYLSSFQHVWAMSFFFFFLNTQRLLALCRLW